ncbi:MAG: DUF2971 domain-containing protein [Stellaceae bacterium]
MASFQTKELFSEQFEQLQKVAPPSPLYHYTDQTGILGIIRSGELWATKMQYMNDTMEFGLVVEVAKKLLKKRENSSAEMEQQLYEWIISNLSNISHANICSISFCHNPDLLSQWRGYPGSGVGFAIGFNTDNLLEAASSNHCRLGRCIYDETDHIKIIDELIDQLEQGAAVSRIRNFHIKSLLLLERRLRRPS